jgi:DNA invertase Pin-like site-specific DNA recombinase
MTDTMTMGKPTIANDLKLGKQCKTILAHLEKGKSISLMESLMVYQISRLSDVIFKLRNAGHDVGTEMRVAESGKEYARYSLNKPLRIVG